MRPDRSTEKVVAFFRGNGSSGFFPREIVSRFTGLTLRTTDRALDRAVQRGDVWKVFSHDGSPYFAYPPFARASPALVDEIKREPLRSLNQSEETRAKRAMERWHALQPTNPRAKKTIDLQVQELPAKLRAQILGANSRLVYPSQFKGAYVCGSCGARFLSTKARRRHEAAKHKLGLWREGSAPTQRARS